MLNKISDSFNPKESFLKLKIVKNTILFFFLSSLISTVMIVYTGWGDLFFDPSYEGFNMAIIIFRVPLGIFAILLTIMAFYSSQHRAEQVLYQMELTQKQLELAQSQNLFTNYYKHQEEFFKYIEKNECSSSIFDKRMLYSNVYAGARLGDYLPSKQALTSMDDACLEWVEGMIDVYENREKFDDSALNKIHSYLWSAFWGELMLDESKFVPVYESLGKGYADMIADIIATIQQCENIYREVIHFNITTEQYKASQLKISNAGNFSTFRIKLGNGSNSKWRDKVAYELLCEIRSDLKT